MPAESPARSFDVNGNVTHWWAALPSVPPDRDCPAYHRLKRVWFDQTRLCPFIVRDEEKVLVRAHEFVTSRHETHLTSTLWENFSIMRCADWLPKLYALAGLPLLTTGVERCNWSYEWERPGVSGLCDVVVEHESTAGERSVLVVESKNFGASLGEKELNFGYYLDRLPEIAAYRDKRSLIFLIDQQLLARVRDQLGDACPPYVGVLTWQQLGGLQIELARILNAAEDIRTFVAGAIQYQFSQHNIRPEQLAAGYLCDEKSTAEIAALPQDERQKQDVRDHPFWRLPADGLGLE